MRVCPSFHPSVHLSVRPSVRNAFVSAGRDKPANDLFRVYELVVFLLKAMFIETLRARILFDMLKT